MANPPITIGPFSNVPAPGSPIASAWPQDISRWVAAVERLASQGQSQGNVPGGGATTKVGATITIPAHATLGRTLIALWYWGISGASAPGVWTPSLRDAAGSSVFITGQPVSYASGQSAAGVLPLFRNVPAGQVATFSTYATVGGASANVNVAGHVMWLTVPFT